VPGVEYVTGLLCVICGACVLALGSLFAGSCMSGWIWLAKRYRFRGSLPQTAFRWQTGAVGTTPYNGCLKISADRNGLFLAMPRCMSFAHPPLLIPWSELTVHAEDVSCFRALGLFSFWSAGILAKFTEVSVSGPPPTRLLLPPYSLPPRVPDAYREVRHCFETEFPNEEIRRVTLDLVDDDRFTVAVSYGYGESAGRRYYAVMRSSMQVSRLIDDP